MGRDLLKDSFRYLIKITLGCTEFGQHHRASSYHSIYDWHLDLFWVVDKLMLVDKWKENRVPREAWRNPYQESVLASPFEADEVLL